MLLLISIFLYSILVYIYHIDSFSIVDHNYNNNMWDLLNYGSSHDDCYSLNSSNCLNYNNCGLCNDGYSSVCIPGDHMGPFFHYNCKNWTHKNFIDGKIFNKNYIIKSNPWYHHYHDYEFKYPQTNTIFNL